MAGSYQHCCNSDADGDSSRKLLAPFYFDMIENMGDAYEACEMMHFMVQRIAMQMSNVAPVQAGIIRDAEEAFFKRTQPPETPAHE